MNQKKAKQLRRLTMQHASGSPKKAYTSFDLPQRLLDPSCQHKLYKLAKQAYKNHLIILPPSRGTSVA